MRLRALSSLLALALAPVCPGVDFTLASKATVTADSITLMKETPMTFIVAKLGNDTTAYKFSQVNLDSLPGDLKQEFNDYRAAQLQKRLVINHDKWVHRDEMLIEADPRYAYAHPLAKFGDSSITFVNQLDQMVTIGVRMGDKGYEMHVAKGKSHGYRIPAGKISVLLVQESPDGTQLLVQRDQVDLKANVALTETVIPSDQVPSSELGVISIPPELRVKPAP